MCTTNPPHFIGARNGSSVLPYYKSIPTSPTSRFRETRSPLHARPLKNAPPLSPPGSGGAGVVVTDGTRKSPRRPKCPICAPPGQAPAGLNLGSLAGNKSRPRPPEEAKSILLERWRSLCFLPPRNPAGQAKDTKGAKGMMGRSLALPILLHGGTRRRHLARSETGAGPRRILRRFTGTVRASP